MLSATSNSTSVFARTRRFPDALSMQDAKAILDELDARAVGREAIAKVLGVSQPNATRLFKPDPRTKKKRLLTYDEGQKLIRHFGLDSTPRSAFNDAVLSRLLEAVIPLVPRSGVTEASATKLAKALVYGLELLGDSPTSSASEDALEVAARGAASRFRDLVLQ